MGSGSHENESFLHSSNKARIDCIEPAICLSILWVAWIMHMDGKRASKTCAFVFETNALDI